MMIVVDPDVRFSCRALVTKLYTYIVHTFKTRLVRNVTQLPNQNKRRYHSAILEVSRGVITIPMI